MKYFIIIDLQKDFTTGALKNDAATAIIPAIVEKAKELKEQGYRIIATRDTHQQNYMETQEGKNLPIPHCIEGTDGWEVVDELKPFVDMYIDKPSFGFNNWEYEFTENQPVPKDVDLFNPTPEAIEMCGTVTEICVASNFATLKATFPEVPITVYKDLCAGLSEETHNAAITVIQAQQGVIK